MCTGFSHTRKEGLKQTGAPGSGGLGSLSARDARRSALANVLLAGGFRPQSEAFPEETIHSPVTPLKSSCAGSSFHVHKQYLCLHVKVITHADTFLFLLMGV